MSKTHSDRSGMGLKRLVTGSFLPRWLRFLLLRIPDVGVGLMLYFIWDAYLQIYSLAPNLYSLVVVTIATLGWVALYASIRYRFTIARAISPLWKTYWGLVIVAITVCISLRRELAVAVLEPAIWSPSYVIIIALLVSASFVAVASMLRTSANVLRLGGFLLVQALLVLTFAQPYLYGSYSDTARVVVDDTLDLARALAESREETIRVLLHLPREQLPSAVRYLRENRPDLPAWFFDTPSLTVLVSGLCERVNFGSALYLSIITWTSVGFGDLVPTTDTRAIAAAESIFGYLFMAALAAVLIRWMHRPTKKSDKEIT